MIASLRNDSVQELICHDQVIVPSETNPTDRPTVAGRSKHRDCALRGAWRRFVGGFAAHASEELEEARLGPVDSSVLDGQKTLVTRASPLVARALLLVARALLLVISSKDGFGGFWLGFRGRVLRPGDEETKRDRRSN